MISCESYSQLTMLHIILYGFFETFRIKLYLPESSFQSEGAEICYGIEFGLAATAPANIATPRASNLDKTGGGILGSARVLCQG